MREEGGNLVGNGGSALRVITRRRKAGVVAGGAVAVELAGVLEGDGRGERRVLLRTVLDFQNFCYGGQLII